MSASPTPRPLRLDRRRILLVAVVLLGAAAGAGLLIAKPWAPSASAQPKSVWQQITAGIADGQVPKQTALEAFSYLYKVPIPGVQVPAGRDGGDAPSSGTGVVRWVQGHWAELTPDQQAVIDRYITAGPNDVVRQMDATAGAGTVSPTEMLALAHTGPAAVRFASDNPLFDAMEVEMLADIKHLGPKLGIPLISPDGISRWSRVSLTFSDSSGGTVLFDTVGTYSKLGGLSPCNITVYKNAWSNLPLVGGKVSDLVRVLMTHEVVHCYQNVIWGDDVSVSKAIPSWIVEGSAIWLAADDTHIVEPWMPFAWSDYFDADKALTNRDYDAVGYFSLLDHEGRNMWGLMASAWRAAAASTTSRSDPFIAVFDGDASDVRNDWAPAYLRRADWQDPWITYGFGLPAAPHVLPHPIDATSGGWPGTLQSRSNSVAVVQASYGEVVTVETTGLVSAHDEATDMVLDVGSDRFCTVDSCVCKPGTLHAGEDMAPQQMRLPFSLAFNAPKGGSTYAVAGHTLDELCGKQAPPPPGGAVPPCVAQLCAGDNGDPHLLTVDRHRYDFQAAGEFTLLRSADGTAEIQGRQEPYANSDHLSVNTAIAARVGGHRVGIYVTADGLEARLDGTPTDVSSPLDLGSGGRLVRYPKGYEIDFPDGTIAWALSVGEYGISVQVSPSAALRKTGVGLLGPAPPGGLGVPLLPDGTRLPRATDRHGAYVELYETLANAWRVTAATTLFDYAAGSSIATFTKADFPTEANARTLTGLPPDKQVAAQLQCAPIVDPDLRAECVFDVAATGVAGFGDQYKLTQGFLQQGPESLGPTGSAAPSVAPASSAPVPSAPASSTPPDAGIPPAGITQLIAKLHKLDGAALAPDGMLYLSIEPTDGQFEVIAADPRLGRIKQQTVADGGGPVAVASGSVWFGQTRADGSCEIVRRDPATLAPQATIPVPCVIDRPEFASLGQSIWFLDQSAVDDSGKGAMLRMIAPATNAPSSTAIALPYANGYIGSSPGSSSIVYGNGDKDAFLLKEGATQLESLGKLPPQFFPTSTGAWSEPGLFGQPAAGENAILVGPGGVLATIPIDGPIVGADDNAVYVSGAAAADGSDTLWRYPRDGSTPVQLAQGAKFGPPENHLDLGYFDDWPFLVGPHEAVKFWLPTSPADPLTSPLDLQWIALP